MKYHKPSYLAVMFIIACAFAINALWIPLKAYCAQRLIEASWYETLSTGAQQTPWPWADHYPQLALNFPDTKRSVIALMGADPSSLAFGPGIMHEFSNTTQTGALVVAGHNDTHFSFLPYLDIGDRISITNQNNDEYFYQIDTISIIDTQQQHLSLAKHDNRLVLVTCYPFESSVRNTTERFIVSAVPIKI